MRTAKNRHETRWSIWVSLGTSSFNLDWQVPEKGKDIRGSDSSGLAVQLRPLGKASSPVQNSHIKKWSWIVQGVDYSWHKDISSGYSFMKGFLDSAARSADRDSLQLPIISGITSVAENSFPFSPSLQASNPLSHHTLVECPRSNRCGYKIPLLSNVGQC